MTRRGAFPRYLPVTPVGEWGDDQTRGVPQVLVAVGQLGSDHLNLTLATRPVIAHLTQPLKIIGVSDVVLSQAHHHVTG